MKPGKEKKRQTVDDKIRAAKVNGILWAVLAAIWIALGIVRLVDGNSTLLTVLNFFIGAVSAVDSILNFNNLKRLLKEKQNPSASEESH